MIITREWISEFIDISQIDNKTLSNKLDFLGLEVDSIVENKTPKDVVIGKITDVSKHPNADRLNICTVDIGKKKHLQIICGSSSVKKDLLVAVAIVGARLANVTIEPIKLRSIDSFGMICSAKEIGIDMPNDDIIILGQVPSNAKIVSLRIYNDDLNSGSGTHNLGLYNGPQAYTISGTTVAAGAVIDEDCYATDSTAFRAATTTATGAEEQLIEVRNINTIANFVWEDGGISEDPKVPLRIAVTMSATGTAVAGDITLVCLYTVD
jgi:tRNA-binding EMAP/Myf-like protein